MVRKLELDALVNDLHSVRKLLARRTPETDPIGFAQFTSRADELEAAIAELEGTPTTRASLAVFFSGQPVQGSRGVEAGFAGKAVDIIQDLIAKQFANLEIGAMAKTGPVPLRGNSDMLLTDVARGSFGVVLEEADRHESLTESQLTVAVRKVAEDIQQAGGTDSAGFDELIAEIDYRYFSSLGALFKLFDDSRATVRLVESERDIQLDDEAIHRGRERTDATITRDDDNIRMVGRLWVLPGDRRFEMVVDGMPDRLSGTVSKTFTVEQLEGLNNGDRWAVQLRERTIVRPNRTPQVRRTLLGLIERLAATPI